MLKIFKSERAIFALLLWIVCTATQWMLVQGYSQVLVTGSTHNASDDSPKLFKALSMDLIYPRTFNSSNHYISTTKDPSITRSATITPKLTKHIAPYKEENQQQAGILYVTPASANDGGGNINVEDAVATEQTITRVTGNPVLTADSQQQQPPPHQQQTITEQQLQLEELEQPLREYESTGRAIDSPGPAYNFNRFRAPLVQNKPPHVALATASHTRPVYAATQPQTAIDIRRVVSANQAEINKLHGNSLFNDRFTPGEAVAAGQFAKQHHNHHQHQPSFSGTKLAQSSNIIQTYTPPKNLYAFPPNLQAKYPAPAKDPKAALPSNSVNSYVAPPSGPLVNSAGYPLASASPANNGNGYNYSGPVNPAYLPPPMKDTMKPYATPAAPSDDDGDNDDTIGVLPASAMDADAGKNSADSAGVDNMNDTNGMDMATNDEHDHPPPEDDKEYPTPPPGWVEEHPDAVHDQPPTAEHHLSPTIVDHDHDSFHSFNHQFELPFDHYPSYPHYYHHFPEIIYDDHHHDHHHIETPPPTLPPITTELPPPEPSPEPRVKKYSYFYIGRKLWYIPLYFTVWFSFYVLWLILKSIARHKVNLPNHYVNRRSLPRYADAPTQEVINELTVAVMEKIENFGRKYIA